VALVVRSLRQALQDGRDPESFEAELATLPNELEDYFKHVLGSISKTKRKKAYQMFAMVLEYEKRATKLSLLSSLYLDAYNESSQFAYKGRLSSAPNSGDLFDLLGAYSTQVIRARKLLQGCCQGLVEKRARPTHIPNFDTDVHDFCKFKFELPAGSRCIMFTHRSTVEFLQKPDVREEMTTTLTGFDVVDAIFVLHLA
jgi:hypothetical protein